MLRINTYISLSTAQMLVSYVFVSYVAVNIYFLSS